ncbi:hypothetical protein Q0Z83_051710 [Actinoplanes sichuanensis]|uniref:Tat pathway signal sequence domain protein n=1 Tax=Actinoplanes sichuanensis TaxID=512349 RepID=A0ABW4ACA9_9ACTN|nr:hypothetical protein [Actinoplanes sichuanensis]BEL06980.1 hypothetical protein Q0Z83_051710 [Actinoplanes sichuanensis]
MNDERLLDADPYRPVAGRLDGAEQSLLEEIMSVPAVPSIPRRRRLAGAVAVAAAVAGILGASTLLPDRRPQPTPLTLPSNGPQVSPSASTGGAGAGHPLDLRYAASHPRLLIDQPGWKLLVIYGFADGTGSVDYEYGPRTVGITWYRADRYQSYLEDRLHVSKPRATRVAGVAAKVFTYSRNDFAVMLDPRDGTFVELRVQGDGVSPAFLDTLLRRIKRVEPEEFLASLPPEVVTPGEATAEGEKALAGVPRPPGFDAGKLGLDGAYTPYQFQARVVKLVACGWAAEWVRADKAGDDAAAETAVAALRSSENWPVLSDMDESKRGDWSRMLWDATSGQSRDMPRDVQNLAGCTE